MKLVTNLAEFYNDISEVIRVFLQAPEIELCEGAPELPLCADDQTVLHLHTEADGVWREQFAYSGAAEQAERPVPQGDELERKKQLKRLVKHTLYLLLKRVTGKRPPWGSLTGIRPTRLIYESLERGLDMDAAEAQLCAEFDTEPAKARLLRDIIEVQRPVYYHAPELFDLYIGIPFCTTKCAYCSFASDELGNGKLVEPYIAALLREIALCGALMRERGYAVRAAYIGGGTPTALSADQLGRVIEAAQAEFPGAVEWTCEAGRPDTITAEKLSRMQALGMSRISINPQTMCDATLELIGRRHDSAETLRAYALARDMGFDDINMDLIAALPGEDEGIFADTLQKVIAAAPESVTVHTLAIKRASKLHERQYTQADPEAAQRMVEHARAELCAAGYAPYYLYRQKYMAGNLENVGYAKPGKACLYNIDIMEETTHNLALGAGAITKWIFPAHRRIERAPNVRNVEQYIARVDEMVERKRAVLDMW